MGRSRKPGPGEPEWLDGFEAEADECECVVLGVGDGKVTIADTVAGGGRAAFRKVAVRDHGRRVRRRPNAVLGPVLGDLAVGALSGALGAVADGGARRSTRREDEGSLDESPLDEGNAAGAGDDDEASPQFGEKPLTVRDLSAVPPGGSQNSSASPTTCGRRRFWSGADLCQDRRPAARAGRTS